MIKHNEAEQAVIGILLTPGDHNEDVYTLLNPEYFEDPVCKKAFDVCSRLYRKRQPLTIVSFATENKIAHLLSMAELAQVVMWSNQMHYNEPLNFYVWQVKDAYSKRSLSKILAEESIGLYDRYDFTTTAQNIITRLSELLQTGETTENIITLQQLTKDEREAYYRRAALNAAGKTTGIETGLKALNKFTGGWQPEFIILAGRPSMGKTALALFHGMKSEKPGIYINLEMNPSQLCQRLILQNAVGHISSSRLRDGNLTQPELHVFEQTIGELEGKMFTIYDKPRCGVHEAIRLIKREAKRDNCSWVVIDYLQLMTIEGFRGGNREAEVAEISRTLKAAQKELGIPIIALAQLSRQVEQRADKKPMLSDLRESGSLEQDADTVCFVWRPAYYGLNKEDGGSYSNEIFYLFEKHRQGSTGTVEFRHNETMTNFYDANQDAGSAFLPVSESTSLNRFGVERELPF